MSTEAHSDPIIASAGARWRKSRARLRARAFWRAIVSRFSSSLTRRIVVLNLGGLLVLVIGFLLLNQFRADIIDARTQSLKTQAGIIAAAIAASAASSPDEPSTITVDPEKLLQLAPSEAAPPAPNDDDSIEFSINPERVGPALHRLVTPTRTRARIYDRDGLLLLELANSFGARRDRASRNGGGGNQKPAVVAAALGRSAPLFRAGRQAACQRGLDNQRQVVA